MFGSEVIEVAIGMAFLFLFMSLIATALREAIENVFKHRAKDLEKGIKEMLREYADKAPEDPNKPNKAGYVDALYNHPLITSLYKGQYKSGSRQLPAYIPKMNFSLALLDIIANASKDGKQLSMASLKQSLVGEKPNDVQRVVLTALATAGDDLAKVRTALEDWYDSTMDRVSSWYAQRTGWILFAIGFLAAASMNVDSITVAKSLITDKSLREAIVAQAEDYPKANAPAVGNQAASGQASKSFSDLRNEFDEVGFPLGWTYQEGALYPTPQTCERTNTDYSCTKDEKLFIGGWLTALMGWLITALAITLGAPFWFDTLNKFVSLRSSLKPDETGSKQAPDPKPAVVGL